MHQKKNIRIHDLNETPFFFPFRNATQEKDKTFNRPSLRFLLQINIDRLK